MASPMLALPAAGGSGTNVAARKATLPLATLITGVGVFMTFAGLIAAYLALKSSSGAWPPKGVTYDNYTASTLTITALMAAVMVEWTAYGIRKNFRGQALFGYGISALLVVAFLNALAFLAGHFAFEAGSSPYATIVYAMAGLVFVVALVALIGLVAVGLRAVGHQLTADNYQLARAGAFLWHIAAVSWFAVYYTVYITK